MTHEFQTLCAQLESLLRSPGRIVLAIDGGAASGKSTLAARLAKQLGGDVIPMDDFFLPLALRTPKRLAQPGGNVHYERFAQQIADPLLAAKHLPKEMPWPILTWDRFDCSAGDFSAERQRTSGKPLLIVEGAYCMRPEFRQLYDLTIFLRVSEGTRKARLLARNGAERCQVFYDRWIPMENKYFTAFCVPESCALRLDDEAL